MTRIEPPNNEDLQRADTAEDFRALVSKRVEPRDILETLLPPHHFANARFENYSPDPLFPSQSEASHAVKLFAQRYKPTTSGFAKLFRFGKSSDEASVMKQGLYLDGGFGIGKTHLLAAAYHTHSGTKAYLTFQELMFLVGLETLKKTFETLRHYELLVLDEFELDDPANTRISTNLLRQLMDAGVLVLTSSNTPPGALGEGKFSVEDFRRELGELTDRFATLRIEGEDYRNTHRTMLTAPSMHEPQSEQRATKHLAISFAELLHTLSLAHPIRIRHALAKYGSITLRDLFSLPDAFSALRFAYLVDKVYDNDIVIRAEPTIDLSTLFPHAIFHGGDTKKYLRALSRLREVLQ
jgi:cell division protein ZapE